MPAAAIFDHDGLTLDTERPWTHAERELFRRYGRTFTMDHKRELLGTSVSVSALKLERMLELPGQGAALQAELYELVMEELRGGVEPLPGIPELLGALRAAGTPIGLCSNSSRAFVARALCVAGMDGAFDAVVCAEDVARPKPAPDPYLAAARALGAEPGACVALEDSHTGVAAARAAGMRVVGIASTSGVSLGEADVVARSASEPAVWEALGLPARVP